MYKEFSDSESLVTQSGFEIKVKEGGRKCVVYKGSSHEVVRAATGDSTIEQEVPHIAFVGKKIVLEKASGRIVLTDTRAGKLLIAYLYGEEREPRKLSMQCLSKADQYPVRLIHYESVKQFIARELSGHAYRYFVLDEDVQRIDMVTLKAKNPDARIVILRPSEMVVPRSRSSSEIAKDKVRAVDMARDGSADSKNQVFMARVYLRNLELEKVRGLIVHFELTVEEIGFVATFLKIMITNEHNNAELVSVKDELIQLERLCHVTAFVAQEDRAGFEKCLQEGIDPYVKEALLELATRRRNKATNKLEELLYWEWQYRLKKAS